MGLIWVAKAMANDFYNIVTAYDKPNISIQILK